MKQAIQLFACLAIFAATTSAEEVESPVPKLGSIKGTFTATAPFPVGIIPALPNLKDETLLINPKNAGLANVVVNLVPKRRPPKRILSDDTKKLVFDTGHLDRRITLLMVGDKLEIENQSKNNDDHVLLYMGKASLELGPFHLVPGKSEVRQHKLVVAYPQEISASFYKRLNRPPYVDRLGYFFVFENNYAAVTDGHGSFCIKDVPEGKYDLCFWHERYKFEEKTELKNNGVIVKQATYMPLAIEAKELDLGTFDYTLK